MKKIFLLLLVTGLTHIGLSQQKDKPKIPLIDLFYEAVSSADSIIGDRSKFTEISLSNYDWEEINPKKIIEKYPEAKRFLLNDSIMVINSISIIQGFIEDLAKFDSRIEISNFHFKKRADINLNLYGELEEEVFNSSRLVFRDCIFEDRFVIWFSNFTLRIKDSQIRKLELINESLVSPKIDIRNNKIDFLSFWTAAPSEISISSNEIGYLEIDKSSALNVDIINNTFSGLKGLNLAEDTIASFGWWQGSALRYRKVGKLIREGKLDVDSAKHFALYQGKKLLHMNSTDRVIAELNITGNTFLDPTHSKPVIFDQRSIKMNVSNNTFEAPVILSPSVSNDFILENNSFYKVNMNAALPTTPQNHVSIDWQDLKGKLYYQKDEDSRGYFGQTDAELKDTRNFFNLMAGHSRLLEVYKSYGNSDDANDVFLDMKALHLNRYEYLYRTEGGTTNFFQLYLNRLLSVYTRHGTDPAQAMTASLWIILCFSVIYFFYPSEWDVSSKSTLLANFRAFKEKNDKGYFKPFLSLLKGLATSLFNAITLSVNSFVTLGFGTIPTRGLAKYICIFQGFLGWFLLSIFIVALINQILV